MSHDLEKMDDTSKVNHSRDPIIENDEDDVPFSFTWKDFYQRNFYISGAWTWDYYFTVRGAENFHIYLWIAKDLAWASDLYWPAMIFGSLALAWCMVLCYFAFFSGGMEEVYMLIATVLWLSGNFVWMAGEVFDGDDDYVVPKTAIMFESAIAWILFYHIFLRPLGLMKTEYNDPTMYFRNGLKCRIPYFHDWREYEHAHTLCWLGKDLSWNQLCQPPWIICLIPTVLIAADFIWCTFKTKRMMEDCVHYLSQLMWVIGNMLWALGNVFVDVNGDDTAYPIFVISRPAKARMRWWACWVLFAAYWPIIILYLVWIPLTIKGAFKSTTRASMIERATKAQRKSEIEAQRKSEIEFK
eukprot:gene12557-13746_t